MRALRFTDAIEDRDVRAVFQEGEAAGLLRFRHAEQTSLDTYYFFRWRDKFGVWQDGLMTGDEIRGSFGRNLMGIKMTDIFIQRTKEFTAVRRERDGWLLGTVHRTEPLDGYSIRVLWPLGVIDAKIYNSEQDAIAAITYRQVITAQRGSAGSVGPIEPEGR